MLEELEYMNSQKSIMLFRDDSVVRVNSIESNSPKLEMLL